MNIAPSSRREHFFAACVLLIATLCCFHRLVLLPSGLVVGPQADGRNDLTANILPSRALPPESLRQFGELPLWQPFELAGIPWLGNPQSAMFYPPNWLYFLTDAVCLAGWLMAAHLWWGGLGVYFYCRKLGLKWAAGLVAGSGYLGAPFLIANACEGHYNPVCIAAWLPWALICFERLRWGQRGGTVLLPLVLALCFFCGHAQEVYYLVLILSCWLVAACLGHQAKDGPSRKTLLMRWCLVGLATLGLTCVELIPIYAYTKQAVRSSGLTMEASARFTLDQTSLWQLIDPLVIHGPEQPTASGRLYWETVCHFGLALTLLAVLGVFAGWNRYGVKRLTIALVCCALFALGTATPFFPFLFHFVPGVSFFRGSSRSLMHLSLLVSLLAGFGVHALLTEFASGSVKRRSFAVWGVGGLAGIILLIFAVNPLGWQFPVPDTVSPRGFNAWTVGLGAGGFLAICLLAKMPFAAAGKLAAILALSVVTLEQSWHAHQVLRVAAAEQFRGDSEVVQFLKTRARTSRVLASQELLSDWEAWRHGISKVHGYEPVPPVRAAVVMEAITRDQAPPDDVVGLQRVHPRRYRPNVLNHLGVQYAVIPSGGPELPKNWQRVARGEIPPAMSLQSGGNHQRYEIWQNADVLPRAFVLGETQTIQHISSPVEQFAEWDARRAVLVSRDVLPEGPRQPYRPAKILEFQPNRVMVEAALDAPGYLVLTDLFAPGWRATVDGSPQAVLPVNVIFRGVALPAGTHQVTFSYTPPGLWLGAIASGSTILSLLFAVAFASAPGRAEDATDTEDAGM